MMRTVRNWPHAVSARRLVLLATTASLGIAALAIGPGGFAPSALLAAPTAKAAEGAQHPVGFADLVERVKPAVISVRVKMDAGAQAMSFQDDWPFSPSSPMQRFFRRFGMPFSEDSPGSSNATRSAVA